MKLWIRPLLCRFMSVTDFRQDGCHTSSWCTYENKLTVLVGNCPFCALGKVKGPGKEETGNRTAHEPPGGLEAAVTARNRAGRARRVVAVDWTRAEARGQEATCPSPTAFSSEDEARETAQPSQQ